MSKIMTCLKGQQTRGPIQNIENNSIIKEKNTTPKDNLDQPIDDNTSIADLLNSYNENMASILNEENNFSQSANKTNDNMITNQENKQENNADGNIGQKIETIITRKIPVTPVANANNLIPDGNANTLTPCFIFKDVKNQLPKEKRKDLRKDDHKKYKKSPYSDYMKKFHGD